MDSVSGESGYCSTTGIYRSPLVPPPPLHLPCVSLPHFLLLSTPAPPTKPAFVDAVSGDSLSYAELHSLTAAAASALSSAGLRRWDLALLVSPNSIHYPVLALAVLSLGAVLSTANPLLTHLELQTQVRDSEPVLIIAAVELLPKLDGILPGRPLIPIEPFLASLPREVDPPLPEVDVGLGHPATVMYSSGTTGKSKGVVSTHGNLTATASLLRHVWGGEARRDDVYACVVPLSHMFGFSVLVCGTLASGATTVVLRRYSVGELLTAVEQHRVTRLPAVPPVVVQMARSCRAGLAGGRGLRSLKEVICSGAPIAREQLERFVECFPGTTVSQCYGLTETSGPITVCDGVRGRFHVSIGRLIPTMEARIADVRTGKALPPYRHGELCVRGPLVMQEVVVSSSEPWNPGVGYLSLGYMKNEEATSLAIDREGWLHTGDLCYIDKRGLVYVVDRIKELIKYKAYQVSPAELEEVLSTHPDVMDVAVTSRYPDEEAGEIPVACVVRKPGSNVEEDDIFAFMDNKVAPYKKIRKVAFVEFIPRSPSGKILRRHLKAAAVRRQRREISARL
ncbi:putative 4-coumarate--CoA ligase-like 8 isoform X1 [Musa acuminata AAA Group]|uniref:putative 4-coumarate--CoA ligase-like 8 isoform X1 n=1 Tax=Musa acuminata AAA Group TaxID=214697 RepID=UPI0031CDD299